ncbi:MAG: SDR family oxidoreductase [Bacteroidota bacterium]
MAHNYLIAGGSSGIGKAIVLQLLQEGHSVLVLSRQRGELPSHPALTHVAIDLATEEVDKSIIPAELHGLAYCPGSINLRPFRSLKTDQFEQDFRINVLGAVKVLQACQRPLKKAGHSSVVLFSTVAVVQGMPFHASVAASKGAIEGLARSLAAEWSPHTRVNCLAPSLTDTPLAANLLSTPEKRDNSAQRHPLKRIGTAEDIASMACFLLSGPGTWISGQIIGIDGGMSRIRT